MAKDALVVAVESLTKATVALTTASQELLTAVKGEKAVSKTTNNSKAAPASSDDLDAKTIQELRQIAKKLGIKAGGSKESLIEAIHAAQGEDDEDDDEDEDEEDDEDEDDDDSDDEDDEDDDEEIDLEEMSDEELIELAEENDVEVPYSGKGSKKKLNRDALIESLEEALNDEDDEEEDEEEISVDDLDDMSDDELKELCEDFDIKIGAKFNRSKAIKALTEYLESEDDEDEE